MPAGVYKRTAYHSRRMSEGLKGHPTSEETKEKIRLSLLGKQRPPEVVEKISKSLMGRVCPEEVKEKISKTCNGRVKSEATKQNMSQAQKGLCHKNRSGEKHWNWKGGITTLQEQIRKSNQYFEWRKSIFERDSYTCVKCGKVSGKLTAHHKKSFAAHPELRFDINNGETLCNTCHPKTDNYGRKGWLLKK